MRWWMKCWDYSREGRVLHRLKRRAPHPSHRNLRPRLRRKFRLMTQVNKHNNMRLPDGKTRLDLVKEGLVDSGSKKRGRMVVSIEKLREDPRNERRTFRNMDGLIESIK